MRRVVLVVMLCTIALTPVAADAPEHLDDAFVSVQVSGAPVIPVLSSFRWTFGFDAFPQAIPNGFRFDLWALSDTPYVIPWPYAFFELGVALNYLPIVRPDWFVAVGAGTAFDFIGLDISIPFYGSAEWGVRAGGDFWSGVGLEGLVWANGAGIELSTSLLYLPDFWLFAALRPKAVVYFVDGMVHLNYRIGLQVGYRSRR